MPLRELSEEMQECVANCLDCHAVCTETIDHCLSKGGEHARPEHIRLLQDCAQISAASADFLLRQSDFHPQTCLVCANVCEQCATSCLTMANGDELLEQCAEICRQCAATCREMSGGDANAASTFGTIA